MTYLKSVKALPVSQSCVIAQFCVGHSTYRHEANIDRAQPPTAAFSPTHLVKGK